MTLSFETTQVAADPRAAELEKLAARGGTFWQSLLGQYEQRGDLSPRQWACVEREMARAVAQSDPALADVQPALAEMVERFALAGEHIKRIAIVLCDEDGAVETRFQPAPANGKNAGWIYVKRHGHTDWGCGWAYIAKVNPENGDIMVARDYEGRSQLVADIRALLADGLDAAVLHYGHATSNCGLCGRGLTEETSVKSGVGPVCADRYGIDRTALIQA